MTIVASRPKPIPPPKSRKMGLTTKTHTECHHRDIRLKSIVGYYLKLGLCRLLSCIGPTTGTHPKTTGPQNQAYKNQKLQLKIIPHHRCMSNLLCDHSPWAYDLEAYTNDAEINWEIGKWHGYMILVVQRGGGVPPSIPLSHIPARKSGNDNNKEAHRTHTYTHVHIFTFR